MTIDAEARAAQRLWAAERDGVPCVPVRDLIGADDIDAAYRVQQINLDAKLADGARIVGRKIGLTSLAVQRQLGVATPDVGTLLADMAFEEGLPIPTGKVMQPKIEAEVALLLGRDLEVDQPTVADVVRAVDAVVPAFEIVGSRIAGWDIQITDTIADNASSGAFVLGGPFHRIHGLDLSTVPMSITKDGQEVSNGIGAACLGHPLNAALWVARRLARAGTPLRAGDLLLTGALGPMVSVAEGTGEYRADFGAFGHVLAVFE